MAMSDLHDTLATLNQLETCRGTILIDSNMMKRAISKLQDSIMINTDSYHQDNQEKLAELLGKKITVYLLRCKSLGQSGFRSIRMVSANPLSAPTGRS